MANHMCSMSGAGHKRENGIEKDFGYLKKTRCVVWQAPNSEYSKLLVSTIPFSKLFVS